jgi:hypothetical protein
MAERADTAKRVLNIFILTMFAQDKVAKELGISLMSGINVRECLVK